MCQRPVCDLFFPRSSPLTSPPPPITFTPSFPHHDVSHGIEENLTESYRNAVLAPMPEAITTQAMKGKWAAHFVREQVRESFDVGGVGGLVWQLALSACDRLFVAATFPFCLPSGSAHPPSFLSRLLPFVFIPLPPPPPPRCAQIAILEILFLLHFLRSKPDAEAIVGLVEVFSDLGFGGIQPYESAFDEETRSVLPRIEHLQVLILVAVLRLEDAYADAGAGLTGHHLLSEGIARRLRAQGGV